MSAPPNQTPHCVSRRMCASPKRRRTQLVAAASPSALPTVSFHSLAHSAPQRLAQLPSTAPSTSFLCASASAGLTLKRWMLASLPSLHGCLSVLQLSVSAMAFLRVSHILFSYALTCSSRKACTLGSSRFQVLRLTARILMLQPSDML